MVAKRKNNLSEKAMLVHLRISSWSGRKLDKRQTREVITTANVASDAGSWWTHMIPKSEIKRVEAANFQVRVTHHKLTLPWMDGGLRILPSAMFMTYTKKMRKVIAEYDEAVSEFVSRYPQMVANAPKRLKKLMNGFQFPTAQAIKTKFSITTDILPMPHASDFRCELSNDEVKDIKTNIENSINTMTATAMSSIWEQLTELIGKIEATMKDPKKIFRDTLISNLKDFCELIPKMNLTDDNKLETLRKEAIAKLAELKPIDLRESKADRKKAHKSAKEILTKMKGYGK